MPKDKDKQLTHHNELFINLKALKKKHLRLSQVKENAENQMQELEADFETLLEDFGEASEKLSSAIGTSINE